MPPIPPDLLGPLGLTVALAIAVYALWRDHVRSDADVLATRDTALAGWRAQTEATERVADGQEELVAAFRDVIREQSTRHRREDQ